MTRTLPIRQQPSREAALVAALLTSADSSPTGPCALAGPTCDGADVLYEDRMVQLPIDLAEGDEVRLLSAGACTSCCSSAGFNGFAPLRTRIMAS